MIGSPSPAPAPDFIFGICCARSLISQGGTAATRLQKLGCQVSLRWGEHVRAVVAGEAGKVVPLRGRCRCLISRLAMMIR
jgi:hypothetical protein